MRCRRASVVSLLALVVACAARAPGAPAGFSGFLDDYSLLRSGGSDDATLVYRAADVPWSSYDAVLFEPVTLWRSGRQSLDAVPEPDLLRLIGDLEAAVRRRRGAGFALAAAPGPGVMRIRLAITEARASDPVLDVLRAHGGDGGTTGDGALDPETRRFVDRAQIEGEIRDATSNRLLAAGVDRRRTDAPALATWASVDDAIDAWAARVCARLEARTRAGRGARPPT